MRPVLPLIPLCLFACNGSSAPQPRPELSWPITEPGKYRVGHQERMLSYSPPGVGGTREIRVQLWYPTQDTTGRAGKYTGEIELDRPEMLDYAKPIDPGGNKLPVLLFSHGHLTFGEQSDFLALYFASHGFVVAAPDHTGNTLADYGTPVTTEIYFFRPSDIRATLDWLYQLPKSDALSGRIGTSVIAAGHSFGGYTVFALAGARFPVTRADCGAMAHPNDYCSTMTDASARLFAQGFTDPRISAIVAMAPGGADVLGPQGVAAIDTPVFLMTSTKDRSTSNATEGNPYWANLNKKNARRIDFQRGGHQTFALTCEIFPVLGTNDGCGDGFIDYREAHNIVSAYALAFARRHLFSDPAADELLEGRTSLSAEVTFSSR